MALGSVGSGQWGVGSGQWGIGIMFCPSDRATTHTTSPIFTFVCVEGKIDHLEGTEEIFLVANL